MNSIAAARQCLSNQDHAQAELLCRQMLDDQSDNAELWHLCGVACAQQGDLDHAVECFQTATDADPSSSINPYNLALALKMQGELDRAIDAYRVAIERREDFLEARSNLGNALVERGSMLEASDCFRELVKRFPDSSDSHFNLANTLSEIGRDGEAVTHYRRAVEIDPDHTAALENLGRAYTDTEQIEEAKEVWRSWLEREPNCEFARHMLAAATGDETPSRCNDDYIRQEFNEDFAKTFDKQLSRLDYKSPELIGEALQSFDPPPQELDILDAGCGTGLCGSIVRPMAKRLVGVDLAPAMLDEARKLNHYDDLIESELTQFLDQNPDSYDLIVSSDTLCYFGELDEVLAAARRSLRDSGTLVFTLEKEANEDAEQPFRLQPHGRYCHTEEYAREALSEAGLTAVAVETAIQRNEGGRPVEGLVITATRD